MLWWSLLCSCKGVEPAPEDLNNLSLYMWRHFSDEEDTALQAGIESLHQIMNVDTLEELLDGSISNLTQNDLDAAGKSDQDASLLSGVFFINKVNCSIEGIEPNVYSLAQDELHPETYDAYERNYTSDFDAYKAREEDFLSWDTTYDISGFGYDYRAHLESTLRFSAVQDDTDFSNMLISRTILKEPAYFDEDSTNRGLFQDFQMEVYYQLDSGDSLHFYAIWREMILFGNMSFASESAQRLVLDGLSDWDRDMEENCSIP